MATKSENRDIIGESQNVVESHADACIGKSAQFHAERTDRELLGRPVARYSAVFLLRWKNVVESCRDAYRWWRTKFATERTDRELLGRPVARHSAVFVFGLINVVELGTLARQSRQNGEFWSFRAEF